jgi:hypothetical protein
MPGAGAVDRRQRSPTTEIDQLIEVDAAPGPQHGTSRLRRRAAVIRKRQFADNSVGARPKHWMDVSTGSRLRRRW